MLRVILVGAAGRMGRAIAECGCEIALAVDPALGTKLAPCKADVVIDFSVAEAAGETVEFCVRNAYPLVLGTTGVPRLEGDFAIPILQCENFSLGALVLTRLSTLAQQLLPGYDARVLEIHHREKRDIPGGTARALSEALHDAPVAAIRAGTVIGTHEAGFYGEMDAVTLRHTATDRRLFAFGAIRAAEKLVCCAPGIYGTDSLFFLLER